MRERRAKKGHVEVAKKIRAVVLAARRQDDRAKVPLARLEEKLDRAWKVYDRADKAFATAHSGYDVRRGRLDDDLRARVGKLLGGLSEMEIEREILKTWKKF